MTISRRLPGSCADRESSDEWSLERRQYECKLCLWMPEDNRQRRALTRLCVRLQRMPTCNGIGFFISSPIPEERDFQHRRRARRDSDAGRWVEQTFCPSCGTLLYMEGEALPEAVVVSVGCFADPAFTAPAASTGQLTGIIGTVWWTVLSPWIKGAGLGLSDCKAHLSAAAAPLLPRFPQV